MAINWNIIGENSIRKKFIIPIGDLSPEEAKKALAELISSYKEDIKFEDKIPGEIEKIKLINFARHCMIQLLTNAQEGSYPEISSYDLHKIEEILKKYEEI